MNSSRPVFEKHSLRGAQWWTGAVQGPGGVTDQHLDTEADSRLSGPEAGANMLGQLGQGWPLENHT